MSRPKVSIIIAVYNAEPYIEKCTRSLFEQTLDSLEYIFVDDNTPDKSIDVMYRVLEEYSRRKDQVKVIRHQQNKGVSQSRQDGLEAATGEYIIHCDPDDWVELDMYESLYNKAKETDADLVICDFMYFNQNQLYYSKQKPHKLDSISLLQSISGQIHPLLHGSTWNKLLKSHWYHHAYFPTDINYCEDVFFWFQILLSNLKIEYISSPLYYYRNNSHGIVNDLSDSKLVLDLNLINYLEQLSSKAPNNTYMLCCRSMIVSIIFFRFFLNRAVSNKKFKQLFYNYQNYLSASSQLGSIKKLLLKYSMIGKHSISLNIYRFLSELKKLRF